MPLLLGSLWSKGKCAASLCASGTRWCVTDLELGSFSFRSLAQEGALFLYVLLQFSDANNKDEIDHWEQPKQNVGERCQSNVQQLYVFTRITWIIRIHSIALTLKITKNS